MRIRPIRWDGEPGFQPRDEEELLCRPPQSPGTYILLIKLEIHAAIRFDKRGHKVAVLEPGYYAYVGSAFGPGGLKSRIERHLGLRRRRLHWHIDRLLLMDYAKVVCIMYSVGCRAERMIASILENMFKPIPGFGSSDDPETSSHLFKVGELHESFHFICNRVYETLKRVCGNASMVIALGD